MESQIVKILATEFVTHNVKRFKTEKPAGYNYLPGQATDVSINRPGLEDELRPFTFTSLNNEDHLEFTIKIYTGHDGVTEKLATLNPGDELIIHEVFGAIQYKGPGVFIAGGAGVTPFIAILRSLHKEGDLTSNVLLFANTTEDDIILKKEFETILGERFINVIDHPKKAETPARYIDRQLLQEHIKPDAYYYVCGPDPFITAMIAHLRTLGVAESEIVIEQ